MKKELDLIKLIEGVELFPAPVKTTRPANSAYEFIIGIGKDHIATITIGKEDYEALMALQLPIN